MKILVVDDQRIFTFPDALHCTTSQSGLEYLYNFQPWDEVWLDHDLGMESEGSGTDIVDTIEYDNNLDLEPKPVVGKFYIHSFNPVGAAYMQQVLERMGYVVERVDPSTLLDYDAMKEKGRDPMLAGPRR